MRPADLPLDRQHRAGPVLLWDAFAVLTEVTVLYRRTGRRRRRLWTWGEHLPPPSVVRNSNMEGQLWVQRRRSWMKLKTEGEVRLCSGRDLVSKETSRRVGIERGRSRNARVLACVGNRSSSAKVRHVAIGPGHLLAVTILIGPNNSTTIGLPLASLPCTP